MSPSDPLARLNAVAEGVIIDSTRDDLPPTTYRHKPTDFEVELARAWQAMMEALEEEYR